MKFKIDHIGYVVKDLKKSSDYFTGVYNHKKITKFIYEKAHGVKIVFLDLGVKTMPALELIQPVGKSSKVYNFLKQNGDKIHHLAYEVKDLKKAINYLLKKNFLQISPVVPGAGHNKSKTCWLMGEKKELVELIQAQPLKKNISRFTC